MFSISIRKKCPLCSKLSSQLKLFFRRVFGEKIDCHGINQRSQSDQRVTQINAAAPDCACEKFRMSHHSPGVVADSEILSRFVFSPYQVDKKGKLKAGAFSHVHNNGCSIQRTSIASNDEIVLFVNRFLAKRDDHVWKGYLVADSVSVRRILTQNSMHRAVCVYDTANAENPSHGEICQTQHVLDKDDEAELRHDLLMAFGNEVIIQPTQFREGAIWNQLSPQFQARG